MTGTKAITGGSGQPRCRQGEPRPGRAQPGLHAYHGAGQRARQPNVVTVGNLIQSGDQNAGTLLTTLVSVDPMYAYFDVDERPVLRIRQLIREGKARSAGETKWAVSLGLAKEEGFPHQGTINFEDNQVNPKTGTLHAGACSPTRMRLYPPAFSPASVYPSVKPTRPCWSPTAPSTPTRVKRSSTS